MLIGLGVGLIAVGVWQDYKAWRKENPKEEVAGYVCYRIGHTKPYQGTGGGSATMNRAAERLMTCRRCGLAFGMKPVGR